jgi:xanthine/CO dehydrogenase XdhC/CoxF family maturation factor
MRAAVSDTAMSGSLPMSSATIESTIWSELRRMLRDDRSDSLKPVTTTWFSASASAGSSCAVSPSSGGCGGSAVVPGCAQAALAENARTAADAEQRIRALRRIDDSP